MLEVVTRDDAVGGGDPDHVAEQGDDRTDAQAAVDGAGVLAQILDEAGHRSVEAEGGQIGGGRAEDEDEFAALAVQAQHGIQTGLADRRWTAGR